MDIKRQIGSKYKNELLQLLNNTTREFSRFACITDLLTTHAKSSPSQIAVSFGNENLTYQELHKKSFELASYLISLNVKVEDRIGIFIEPSLDLMVSAWGVLFSGGAYLPLSPEYPPERLRYMLEDSGTNIVFTHEDLKEQLIALVPTGTKIITINDVNEFIKNNFNNLKVSHLSPPNLNPNNLAYVIYTSGSTGHPKGVLIEHHSVVNQMQWLEESFSFNESTVILQKTPMSFDAAQWEILAPSCGVKVVMGPPSAYKNPDILIETIQKYGITTLQCVPTLLQVLMENDEFCNCKTLKTIFSGGEALSKDLALECLSVLPSTSLINLYGPTECTINTSAFIVNPFTLNKSPSTISIGSPLFNTQYYILDDNKNPVDIGVTGELYIGGEGLARGYLNQAELTAQKFVPNPFNSELRSNRLYRSGDLAYWNIDGTVQYVGRIDNQVKLRGYRIELDEIKSSIEEHKWIKNSVAVVKNDSHTGYQNLIAFIELNPKEAALMDQGNHDPHHQSKESKAQVMLQLANKGCREVSELSKKYIVNLPGKFATQYQNEKVFSRKTYRFFNGGNLELTKIIQLLDESEINSKKANLEDLVLLELGSMLRYFGQFISDKRFLPKYGYASPGALYATQMYLELNNIGNLVAGFYYYHPIHHQLYLIKKIDTSSKIEFKLHFVGKKSAIEPIYKNNILEVLEIETGHMVGLFENILPDFGLSIVESEFRPETKKNLHVAEEDYYLGSFEIISGNENRMKEDIDLFVQIHSNKILSLDPGLYLYKNKNLEKISNEIILRKEVIAINQEVYDRASFGITAISKTSAPWKEYINLGRKLQQLQMNDLNIGFMSAGYSSKTGSDLPSAKKIKQILGNEIGPSYFFVGGLISEEQKKSTGMQEDTVHMKGPAEMIHDDLVKFLPPHMIPNKVIVLNKMPLTSNGKIDINALNKIDVELSQRDYVAPRNAIEVKIQNIWKKELKKAIISIDDSFFELGGNSLIAVSLINKINKLLKSNLSLQSLFESPTIEKLANKIISHDSGSSSRLVPLQTKGVDYPIFIWPGLGGYCMNLHSLAKKTGRDHPIFGIQAYGINENERPYSTIEEMASEDIKLLKKKQREGPYNLWGYSFGSRVAVEVASQLEQAGDIVNHLFLIAPGSPKIANSKDFKNQDQAEFNNKTFLTILFSVFMGNIEKSAIAECFKFANDEESFIKFITQKNNKLEPKLIKRIINIVATTYEFGNEPEYLNGKVLYTPITIFKTKGDKCSIFEESTSFLFNNCAILPLTADHYGVLKSPYVEELARILMANIRN
jgi:amino acid adenylation domain-containing protein